MDTAPGGTAVLFKHRSQGWKVSRKLRQGSSYNGSFPKPHSSFWCPLKNNSLALLIGQLRLAFHISLGLRHQQKRCLLQLDASTGLSSSADQHSLFPFSYLHIICIFYLSLLSWGQVSLLRNEHCIPQSSSPHLSDKALGVFHSVII